MAVVALMMRWCLEGVNGGGRMMGRGLGGGGSRLSPSGCVFSLVVSLIFGWVDRLAGLRNLWW
jgi:hypothetical protein